MKKLKPEDFLKKNNVIRSDYTTDQMFPLNLSRDTNIRTTKDIIRAMAEYAEYRIGQDKKSIIENGGLVIE